METQDAAWYAGTVSGSAQTLLAINLNEIDTLDHEATQPEGLE